MRDPAEFDITITGNDDSTPVPQCQDHSPSVLDMTMAEDRYSRLRLIPWWDQDLLRQARVLVVGAGALGNEIVKNLTLLGIGHILICDMDRIENSNLSRSALFRDSDEGKHKAEVIARSARELNPDVKAEAFVGNIVHDLGLGVFRAFDVIIGGLDNREARLHINQSCWKVNRPWIDGAIEVISGVARVFSPPDSACYECTMSELDFELLRKRKSCSLLSRDQMLEGKIPTTPTTSSVIAGIECQEAVKLLHQRPELPVLTGKGFYFNGITNESFIVEYQRKDDCLSHDCYAGIEEMPWQAASLTAGELISYISSRLGTTAVVELEREIVQSFECRSCGVTTPVFRALTRLTEVDARCPSCGEQRWPRMSHILEDNPAYAHMTLTDLGIPPLDIVTGRVGLDRLHLELSGDRASLLSWLQ